MSVGILNHNLANLISFSRIIGVGCVFWLTPFSDQLTQAWVIIIYTLICATDFLDGWVARRYNMVSDLGKILDPLADKILVLVFLPLLSMQAISAFPVFVILSREFAVMALRVFSAKDNLILAAGISGKLKTAITLPICGILLGRVVVAPSADYPSLLTPLLMLQNWVVAWPSWIFETLIWGMVGVTVWSFIDYCVQFFYQRALQKAKGDPEQAKHHLKAFIPNSITFLNLSMGLLAIFFSLVGQTHFAVGFILIGIVLDSLDGRFARLLGVFSSFGEALDSQADLVTFGMGPAVLIACTDLPLFGPLGAWVSLLLGLFYYGCTHYRLHRFGGHSDYFTGLPSPAGAGLVAVAAISTQLSQPWYFAGISVLASVLMVSRFAYPHNRIANQKWIFRMSRIPSFICWLLSLLFCFNVPLLYADIIINALFALTCLYVFSPLWNRVRLN
ncbi:MAG: hypothetical protein CL521_03365 [Actinobacteria bacterium]|nr:hypothetical protein [Actinomycetota bacterium]